MKNLSVKGETQNVYSEKRDENAPKKKPFNKTYDKKEEEPEIELDSDGFETIGTKPVKKTTYQKKDYEHKPRRFDGEKKDRKDRNYTRRPKEENKEEDTPAAEQKPKKAIEEKPVVVEVKAKNLKDLFA